MNIDAILDQARVLIDDDGKKIVEIAECGVCGRTWNDAAVSSITPAPSGRCPYEMDSENPCGQEVKIDL